MKVGWIHHTIDLEEEVPFGKEMELECDECSKDAKYEVMYEEKNNFKTRIVYLCGSCEKQIEDAP